MPSLTLLAVRPARSLNGLPLDPLGQATAVLGPAALTFAVISGGAHGFRAPSVLAALVVAVLAGACFFVVESRVARPMVPLGLFRSPAVARVLAFDRILDQRRVLRRRAFVLSLYFQRELGLSAVAAGLMFLPMTGLLTVANLGSARVAARWGHHVPVRVGLSVGTLGMLLLAFLPVFLPGQIWLEIAPLVPHGGGLVRAAVADVPATRLAARGAGRAGGRPVQRGQADGRRGWPWPPRRPGRGSFVTGMRVSLLISAVLLLVTPQPRSPSSVAGLAYLL